MKSEKGPIEKHTHFLKSYYFMFEPYVRQNKKIYLRFWEIVIIVHFIELIIYLLIKINIQINQW